MLRIEMGDVAEVRPQPRGKVGRPRDARLDDAIVAATVELLEERGYNELTLAAVAERAGTTTPAIYRRWSSKSDLVAQAVFRIEGPDVVADTGDIRADLRTMIEWSIEKLCRPAGRAALAGLLAETGSARTEHARAMVSLWARVGERLERAKAAGELRSELDNDVLVSLISGPVLQASIALGDDRIDRRWVDDIVSVVLDGATPRPDPVRRSTTEGE